MGNVEIPNWLNGLPLAPEFRPTDTEFADPIAYISKIEKEASAFGICKIIPPLPKPSKRYVFCNLNKSLSKCPELGMDLNSLNVPRIGDCGNDGEVRAVFTTRHQELGHSGKRTKGAVSNPQLSVHKQVWQSGEVYTLEQFESKSKAFARSLLGMIKEVSPLVVETLFWKAASEKPIYVEYANDVPGSGFGEPDGQFRYFHTRRRKRMSYRRRSRESFDCNKSEKEVVENSHTDESKDISVKNDANECLETPTSLNTSSTMLSDETSRPFRRKSVNGSNDMEGTAGWKLSNSPWNLQVMARSPGSLTRFMPDDIPGVTSPMVYIGMLFSWFAWHVEDHELHSMNFLHTGSPKTWYAVPGDYAFAFEEVIRSEAYGGNIDRLAALTLLGEKTTLLSPEVVVASGIPCCRLVQNPGEFVVTFPRAYHVGFSHGFNCGEAANFGTPQWLAVAKEAAVRRAAMNYLPMLSHQQLLYLLTMSFVSRVPRSLLPGARSSRLRDRQKEERELLVKKAFIEDMLNENSVLSVLLGKESSCHAVIWNADLLPCPSKEPPLSNVTAAVATTPKDNVSESHSENHDSNEQNNLFEEMSLYMENLNDLYLDDDDLSCDFQVDSGTLACVACGILGFPFMSVVQPSERASIELLPVDHLLVQEGPGVSKPENACSSANLEGTVKGSVSEDQLHVSDHSAPTKNVPTPSITKFDQGWNTSCKFLRPRIFCLEHAVQIDQLLRSKGGANMLIICHSDYQKIKAHAASIAEEIGIPFKYGEVPLETASHEHLNLIDLAIDGENHDECGEDWTSKLDINLRYCVKVRKNSPSMQIQHALKLGGLLFDKSSGTLNIKWKSRKARSKFKPGHKAHSKPLERIEANKGVGETSDVVIVKKVEKLLQYSRRKFKLKPDYSKESCSIGSKADSTGLGFSPSDVPEVVRNVNCVASQVPDPPPTSSVVGSVSGQSENQTSKEVRLKGKSCDLDIHSFNIQVETIAINGRNEIENSSAETCSSLHAVATNGKLEVQGDDQLTEKFNVTKDATMMVSEGQDGVLGNKGVLMNELSDPVKPANSLVDQLAVENFVTQAGNAVLERSGMKNDVCDSMTLGTKMQQEFQVGEISMDKGMISCTLIHQPTALETCSREDACNGVFLEDKLQEEIKIISSSNNGVALDNEVLQGVQTSNGNEEELSSRVSVEECFEVSKGACELVTLDTQQEIQVTKRNNSVTKKEENLCVPAMVEEKSEVLKGTCGEGTLSSGVTEDNEREKDQTINAVNEELIELNQSTTVPSQKCSRIEGESGATENSHSGGEVCSLQQNREMENTKSDLDPPSTTGKGRKRKKEVEQQTDNKLNCNGFIKSPCEGLRPRGGKDAANRSGVDTGKSTEEKPVKKKARKPSDVLVPSQKKKQSSKGRHKCDLEGCRMSFETKAELVLHKRNRCPYEGCRKRFRSHKYAMLHQRVHEDDRPLKCPWKGCSMSFKWAWARTEHIRVHTGERPYQCKVEGCGRSFRFVSDFSRHRRKTGHYVNSPP